MNHFRQGLQHLKARLKSLGERFVSSQDATAVVEFAIILPAMIFLYIGSVEASRALTYDRRLESASAALGDLVSQSPTDILESELNDLFAAAKTTIAPHDASGVKQVVTCVRLLANGDTNVLWSHGYNGGTTHTVNTSFNLPDDFKAIAGDTYVIVSEAELGYTPLTGIVMAGGFKMHSINYYLPRFGSFIDVVPG